MDFNQGTSDPLFLRTGRRNKKHSMVEKHSTQDSLDKNPFFQSTFVRWEKTLGKIPHRSSYFTVDSPKRLTGGADKGASANRNAFVSEPSPTADSTGHLAIPQAYNRVAHRTIEDRKVDDIIDCAIQNLQAAGKALATLGGNHEAEIKRVLMEFMAKSQRWMGDVQQKLDATTVDLTDLRKAVGTLNNDLAAKDIELRNLQDQVTQLATEKAAYEQALDNNRPNVPEGRPQVDTSFLSIPPSGAGKPPTVAPSLDIPSIMLSAPSNDALRTQRPVESRSALQQEAGGPSSAGVGFAPSAPSLPPMQAADASLQVPSQQDVISTISSINLLGADDQGQGGLRPIATAGVQASVGNLPTIPASTQHPGSSPNFASQAAQLGQAPETRVQELEKELENLRNENERMRKEHAEYEAAMERALLQGVSSLNAEALKVLKNPPFVCYKPCEPCNPCLASSANTMTPAVPCVLQVVKDDCHHERPGKSKGKGPWRARDCRPMKTPANLCYTPAISDIPETAEDSMLFLLPQENSQCPNSRFCVHSENTGFTVVGSSNMKSKTRQNRDGFRRECIREYVCVNDGPEVISGPPRRCDPRYRRRFFNN